MKIVVTGGAGFIGSHACKCLAKNGHEPIVYDNLCYGHEHAVKWGPLEVGDINDGKRLKDVLKQYQPACVMHFAAFAYVGESVQEPARYYKNNVVGTLSLLDAMRESGVENIVFSSTCATYGIPESLPIVETTPQYPINPYGQTKLMVERILADYQLAYGLNWIALRYFNAAGSDPGGEIGEEHDPETHALPLAILAALGSGTFNIMGSDYDTPDGTAIRDYIHVNDLAEAHLKAVDYLMEGGVSQAFNLATGQGVSVRELVHSVQDVSGRDVPHTFTSRRVGDPPSLFASAERARTVLGWTPHYQHIDDIVRTSYDWFLKQHNNQQ